MKLLLENKKVVFITLFVFICGILFQISRTQIMLISITNENIVEKPLHPSNFEQVEANENPSYCIVFNESSLPVSNNAEKVLQYMKKSYKTYNSTSEKVSLTSCETVIHTTDYIDHLGTIEEIEDYVRHGGKLLFLQTLEPSTHFQVLYPRFGIIHHDFFTQTRGIHMTSNILIGAADKEFLTESFNTDSYDISLNVSLNNNAEVYMTNDMNVPLAWKSNFGKGHFVLFNSKLLYGKTSRGIITGLLSITEDAYIYPIFNAKTFYIDDFPSPIANGKNEIIYNEYKKKLPAFYQSIWWPDMLKVARKYNIKYTGSLIQTYSDQVLPPFQTNNEDELNVLIRYGRELIHGGGELSFHGYNHHSLTTDEKVSSFYGYNNWQSKDHMVEALTELKNYASKAFPSYIVRSYVPPSNVLSEIGRAALKEALPDLVTINSLYGEDPFGRSHIQEYEIGSDNLIDMPRISSGYLITDTNEWDIANAINLHGVFSHFVHPDEDRSQGGWSEIFDEFENFIEDIHKRYPWLRALTATSAANLQAGTLTMQVQFEQDENKIIGNMQHVNESQYFILRLKKEIKSTKNCTFEKIDEDTYLVVSQSKTFEIHY